MEIIYNNNLSNENQEILDILIGYIESHYQAKIYFNKDEIKYKKGGRTLITIYVNDELTVLIIFGKKEREEFDAKRNKFSQLIQDYYDNSKTYHDGKWMYIKTNSIDIIADLIKLLNIKAKANKKAMTLCGDRCDLCHAYVKNINKDDKRKELALVFKKYYNSQIEPNVLYCEGCRNTKKDVVLLDNNCPVRKCVMDKNLNSCADCDDYPCSTFDLRKGLTYCRAINYQDFDSKEFIEYLHAFDNGTRIDRLRKMYNGK